MTRSSVASYQTDNDKTGQGVDAMPIEIALPHCFSKLASIEAWCGVHNIVYKFAVTATQMVFGFTSDDDKMLFGLRWI